MKRYYLAVGYPLTYAIDNPSVYILEQKEGTVALTTEELKEWSMCLRVNARDEESEILQSLVRKGAVYDAESPEKLLETIRERNAIRQGFGFVYNKKYSILVGKEYWYPSRGQLILWSGADDLTTVQGLMELAKEEKLSEMQAFHCITTLMQNDSLFLR